MGFDLKVWVAVLVVLEWIHISHEVAAFAVRADELLHASVLIKSAFAVNVNVLCPANRGIGQSNGSENFFVEIMPACQALVHELQKFTRASALNDTVVIGTGQRDGL